MSRKTQRNQSNPQRQDSPSPVAHETSGSRSKEILTWSVVVVLLVAAAWMLLFNSKATQPSQPAITSNAAALASEHSPVLGTANAKVHIVEFLDPACETCATFFPVVKQMMVDNPDKIRLSIRHVPFHQGSEYVVRLLEASRKQDKYWQTLEALLASQAQWAPHHTVQPDRVWPAIAGLGLNTDQLMTDMSAPEVDQRMQRDIDDARALKVTATPEYFVNGRSLPSFGLQQLQALVGEALQQAD
jgi:protein-disulfide isomerase